MTVTLLVRGGEVELHESEKFNKVRHRLNRARKLSEDYKNGTIGGSKDNGDQKFEPFHLLTFRTEIEDEDGGGRITVDIENVIGALSDEPRDVGGGSAEDDDDE
jgi:hypothetical protein